MTENPNEEIEFALANVVGPDSMVTGWMLVFTATDAEGSESTTFAHPLDQRTTTSLGLVTVAELFAQREWMRIANG